MKKTIKKELRSWGIIGGIALVLYLTGLHTQVISYLQRAILATGLIRPNTEQPTDQEVNVQPTIDLQIPLRDAEGETLNLDQFRGRAIFINLWATWCPPCLAEMPGIDRLYQDLESEDIVFIMLSLDEDFSKAVNFVQGKGYAFPVYQAAGRWPGALNSSTIPSTFVLDRDGKLVLQHRGMAKYNTEDFRTFLREL